VLFVRIPTFPKTAAVIGKVKSAQGRCPVCRTNQS
jgi:hypothetical protein